MMDPLGTGTSYSNNVYSVEFFELSRQHLKPHGVLFTWVGQSYNVMYKTVASVFKHVSVYHAMCLGSDIPLSQSVALRERLLESLTPTLAAKVRKSLHESRAMQFLGNEDYVRRSSSAFPTNRDLRPICEYYLGWQMLERVWADRSRSDNLGE